MTAGQAVRRGAEVLAGAGMPEARRECGALVRVLTGVDPRLHPDRLLDAAAVQKCADAVTRRARREPFAYIVGRREFWGLDLLVRQGVFIPRPDTETLVETALRRLPGRGLACDLCTGSGAVALALAVERPVAEVDATDLSPDALAAVADNANRLGLQDRVRAAGGDLFGGLPRGRRGMYDVCTCNPPYVAPSEWAELPPEIRDWEPRVALVPPEGWRALYRRLAAGATAWLRPGGWLLCEVGRGQAAEVAALMRGEGLEAVGLHRDLARTARVVEGRRP